MKRFALFALALAWLAACDRPPSAPTPQFEATALPEVSAYTGGPAGPVQNQSPIPCKGGEKVLLIQDNVPWFAAAGQDPLGANVTELKAQKKNFCIANSKDVGTTNLAQFREILISAAQNQAFYNNLFPGGVIHPAITAYVQNGGILSANLTDVASGPGAGGTWAGDFFVGGVQHVIAFSNFNDIADPTHPVITDLLPCPSGNCAPIVDGPGAFDDFDGWGFDSHGFFTTLPLGTTVIIKDQVTATPVMVEYFFGSGVVIATLTTTEWRYVGDFGALPQNKKLLANEIAYQDFLTKPTPGKVTGGGQIVGDDPLFSPIGDLLSPPAIMLTSTGAEASFGFVVQDGTNPKGNLVYNDHGADVRIKATSFSFLSIRNGVCGPNTHARFEGTADVNGTSESLVVDVDDCGEPGSVPPGPPDTFSITTDSYSNSGPLIRGNIQIHP
jgi:hypothetical protein